MIPSLAQRQTKPDASHHATPFAASARLSLVPPPHQPLSPLALWHLLSLDAPTVATLWTLFIAHCANLALSWPAPAAMFVAVWMIYAADRLLDTRLLDTHPPANIPGAPGLASETWVSTDARPLDTHPPPDLEARHRFHHQHRNRFLATITLSALALVYLLHRLDARALHLYALLATLLAAWMLVIHSQPLLLHARPLPTGTTRRLPKELAVGIFFPAAVFIPTIAREPALRPILLPAAALFACVCTLNCLYLYAWEHPAPRLQAPHATPHSSAHSTTRWATLHLTQLAAFVLALSSTTAALYLPHHALATGLPALACALSAASLLFLNTLRNRISAIHLRAAADLALLTPLLLLPFLHFFAR